jgi:hypothetical protein
MQAWRIMTAIISSLLKRDNGHGSGKLINAEAGFGFFGINSGILTYSII